MRQSHYIPPHSRVDSWRPSSNHYNLGRSDYRDSPYRTNAVYSSPTSNFSHYTSDSSQRTHDSFVPKYAAQPSQRHESRSNCRSHAAFAPPNAIAAEDKSPAPSESSRIMPKNFENPLTCFYWATQGRCAKTADECWYCHYWTGIVAAAPVRLGGGTAIAGASASRRVEELSKGDDIMKARVNFISERERQMDEDEKRVNYCAAQLEVNIKKLHDALHALDTACQGATKSLETHYCELAEHSSHNANQVLLAEQAAVTLNASLRVLSDLRNRINATAYHLRESLSVVGADEEPHEYHHAQAVTTPERKTPRPILGLPTSTSVELECCDAVATASFDHDAVSSSGGIGIKSLRKDEQVQLLEKKVHQGQDFPGMLHQNTILNNNTAMEEDDKPQQEHTMIGAQE